MSSSPSVERRKAKIVCTIGPASSDRRIISLMIKNGMNVARLNFSHGDYETHKKRIDLVRQISKDLRTPVAILQDLQGVKIRVGNIEGGSVELKKGRELVLAPGDKVGNRDVIFISYPSLLREVNKGDRILLDDGLIQLTVTGKTRNGLRTTVIEGGILRDRKGVNLPGVKLSIKAFTEKDENDLAFGMEMGVDYVAISFVREAEDIRKVKEWMLRRNQSIPVIAKIEKPEALCNIEEIFSEVDGIMIARGDLGVEIPPEEVPLIQKGLIEKANKKGKIVITATQMLESMTEHLRPTRAEATDVANAVLDGTDALMLSAETASGRYPIEALQMMNRIIRHTEQMKETESSYIRGNIFAEATADAACRAAEDIDARVLVAFTQSGFTARLLSKFRPGVPIIALTPDGKIENRVSLYWGVTPKIMQLPATTDEMISGIEKSLLSERVVRKGDVIVITSSSPLSTQGKTNFMKLHRIGE
ncbi:MAG TPA: pyruvate kinase [Thermodesulfovibrionales bacterium]|nr:pyruvate kinase [Thermodesulfovibrionales bacterium]